jgi:hypothetical protein
MKAMWNPAGSEEKSDLEVEITENCKGAIVGQKYLYGNRAFVKHAASMINADACDIIIADEIPNEESEGTISIYISNDSKDPNPPPHRTSTPLTPIPAHEIITTDDEVYGVTYEASPFTLIRRRARGSRSRNAGARSQISSAAQEEMERRVTTEDAVARMGTWEGRIRAVEAEVIRRRFAGADGRGSGALLGLLPPWYVGMQRRWWIWSWRCEWKFQW